MRICQDQFMPAPTGHYGGHLNMLNNNPPFIDVFIRESAISFLWQLDNWNLEIEIY